MCVNQLFVLSVRLPVNNKLFVVKFWGSVKVIPGFWTAWGVGAPNPHIVQG